MASTVRLASVVGLGLLAVIALTGCIAPGSGYAILDREAEPGDVLPTDLPEFADDELTTTSLRFVGEHNGNSLYLAKGREDGSVCLLISPADPSEALMGCGGGAQLGVEGPAGDYLVRPDAAPEPENAVRISTNVFAVE